MPVHGTQYPLSSTAIEQSNAETWAAVLTWNTYGGGLEWTDNLPDGIADLVKEIEKVADESGAVSPCPSLKYQPHH
jgi:hypothetical protein